MATINTYKYTSTFHALLLKEPGSNDIPVAIECTRFWFLVTLFNKRNMAPWRNC